MQGKKKFPNVILCFDTKKKNPQKTPKQTPEKQTTNSCCSFLTVPCPTWQNLNPQQSYSGGGEKKVQFLSLFRLSHTFQCHHHHLMCTVQPPWPCAAFKAQHGWLFLLADPSVSLHSGSAMPSQNTDADHRPAAPEWIRFQPLPSGRIMSQHLDCKSE